jgi:hypothetical protein
MHDLFISVALVYLYCIKSRADVTLLVSVVMLIGV